MKTNTETVQALYEAFAQGNVPFILESVNDNFTWFATPATQLLFRTGAIT